MLYHCKISNLGAFRLLHQAPQLPGEKILCDHKVIPNQIPNHHIFVSGNDVEEIGVRV